MQFQRLKITNWRCFEEETIQFKNGVTVLYGNNGAGKSSLLEAAFFALYGTDAFDSKTTMDDVVTTDEDTAEVVLSFAHRGNSYEVTREIRIRKSTYQEAELATPPGQPNLEQTGAIDDLIREEIRLNAEDFLNSAYVRQGDVTRLIEATPKQRQRIIDNLLQMSKLERYRDRMSSIGTGVGRVQENKNAQIQQLTEQIAKFDEPQIRSRKRQLEGFEAELDDRKDEIDEQIEELEREKESAAETVDQQEEYQQQVEDAEGEVEDRVAELSDEVSEYQSHLDDLETAEEAVSQHLDELETLLQVGTGDLETTFSDANELQDAATETAERTASEALTESAEPPSDDGAGLLTGTDLADIAASIVGQADSDALDVESQSIDEMLADTEVSLPELSPAVTGGTLDDDVATVGTTPAVEPEKIDPVISPGVSVEVPSVRVPTPGLEADPGTMEVDRAAEAYSEAESTVSDIRERLKELESAVEDARSNAESLERDADTHDREHDSHLEDASAVLTEITDIRKGRDLLSEEREELRTDITDSDVDVTPESDDPRQPLEAAASSLASKIDRLESEREDRNQRATKLGERIDQADRLLEEGNCPECGRPVDGAPNVEHREEWESERASLRELVELMDEDIEELEARKDEADGLLERARDLYADDRTVTVPESTNGASAKTVDPTTDLRPLYEEAAEAHLRARDERESAYANRRQAVAQYLIATLLERAAERTLAHLYRALSREVLLYKIQNKADDRDGAEQDRTLAETRLDNQASTVADVHEELHDAITRHSDAAARFDPDELDRAATTVDEKEDEIESLEDDLERLQDTQKALNNDLGDLDRQLKELEERREERTTRQKEAQAVAALQEQAAELESMFVDLRESLRKQNVERLEALLKEMFDTLYRNDAYADIELDKDYDATLIEKSGGKLSPDKLSGGESAVFNLALRGAIYRLLTEGFEDDVPMPPLILDEPTAHLDAGHVERLDDVVEAMRTAGVKQTIVVSHNEELIDGADQRIQVRQQQGTNRSVAEAESGVPLSL